MNKKDVMRIVGNRLREKRKTILREFLETQPDVEMSWNEWTRILTEYMKSKRSKSNG